MILCMSSDHRRLQERNVQKGIEDVKRLLFKNASKQGLMINKNVHAKTANLLRKKSAQNVHEDEPTYLQLREPIEAVANDVIQDTRLFADHADMFDEDEFEASDYFKVRAMSPNQTPDKVLFKLGAALQELASKLCGYPTLPANQKNHRVT